MEVKMDSAQRSSDETQAPDSTTQKDREPTTLVGPEFGATFVRGTLCKPLTWASCG